MTMTCFRIALTCGGAIIKALIFTCDYMVLSGGGSIPLKGGAGMVLIWSAFGRGRIPL